MMKFKRSFTNSTQSYIISLLIIAFINNVINFAFIILLMEHTFAAFTVIFTAILQNIFYIYLYKKLKHEKSYN